MKDIANTPLVSIICSTYNHGLYISQCLDGFLMQKTNFPFEILIHDDASTDNTPDIIREYEHNHPQVIRPIYQKENKYSKKEDIFAKYQCSRVRGKYIAICEGDDYWIDPLKLQKQIDFLENNPDYGMIYTTSKVYNQKEGKIEKDIIDSSNVIKTKVNDKIITNLNSINIEKISPMEAFGILNDLINIAKSDNE